ncbi:MAG: cyclic peptide export ABC transporter [Acidobacteriaceae bacterium]|nr:cyclic peptide export ABC transporter [Acidobacteriaceae bacterium]
MIAILRYLIRLSPWLLLLSVLMACVCAAANVFLMQITVKAFQPLAHTRFPYIEFWALCGATLVSRSLSEVSLTKVSQHNVRRLRVQIAHQIAHLSQKAVEMLPTGSIISTISSDIASLSAFGQMFPLVMMDLLIVLGVFAYLFQVSPSLFVLVVVGVVATVFFHHLTGRKANSLLGRDRIVQTSFFAEFNTLLGGSKELRLNPAKHMRTLANVERTADLSCEIGYEANKRYALGGAVAVASYFLLFGVLLALSEANRFGIDRRAVLSAVMAVLFMRSAVESFVNIVPTIIRGKVALQYIQALGLRLEAALDRDNDFQIAEPRRFKCICVADVVYEYGSTNGQIPFRLGPFSVDVRAGETLFVCGGNGSGKTSFLKVLSGLYSPAAGAIEMDGTLVTSSNAAEYRQMFAAVFQDFFLLRELPQLHDVSCLRRAEEYLAEFDLSEKVLIKGDRFVFDELSRGQQKRLALVIALLESRPILLLDEWAADQDPKFKTYFYTSVLKRVKTEGTTVIAVTHDDLFYGVADRIVLLRDGRLA